MDEVSHIAGIASGSKLDIRCDDMQTINAGSELKLNDA